MVWLVAKVHLVVEAPSPLVAVAGLPPPEVLAGVRRQELVRAHKRRGVKFLVHSDKARRLLALLRLQQKRRARERDRGRIRLRLFD